MSFVKAHPLIYTFLKTFFVTYFGKEPQNVVIHGSHILIRSSNDNPEGREYKDGRQFSTLITKSGLQLEIIVK
jgi:hypothetical protein